MVELIVVVVVLVLAWASIKRLFKFIGEKTNIWAIKQEVTLQDDLKDTLEEINNVKSRNDGKWFTLDDLEKAMT